MPARGRRWRSKVLGLKPHAPRVLASRWIESRNGGRIQGMLVPIVTFAAAARDGQARVLAVTAERQASGDGWASAADGPKYSSRGRRSPPDTSWRAPLTPTGGDRIGGLALDDPPGSAPLATARDALQSCTEASHLRLHGHPGFVALLRGEFSRLAYLQLLQRLLGLHDPVEERLAQHDGGPWMAWRRIAALPPRAERLRQDLRDLGLAPQGLQALPRADDLLPGLADPAAALGCAWVVEGSALGGRLLARRLDSILAGGPGGRFFAQDTAGPERWRALVAAVEACGADPARRAVMTSTASATFAAFETWLGSDR